MNVFIQKLLTISLLFCPLSVLGQTGNWTDEGNYTEDWYSSQANGNDFTITSSNDLAAFAKAVNEGNLFEGKNVTISLSDPEQEIDLSSHNWIPIGRDNSVNAKEITFKGIFDGNNCTIKNISINAESVDYKDTGLYLGLFGNNGGTIKNITVNNCLIHGNMTLSSPVYEVCVGAIVGHNYNGTITNCHNKGSNNMIDMTTVNGGFQSLGGIVGNSSAYEEGKTITNCTNSQDITYNKVFDAVGGIVGSNHKTNVSDCKNTGNIIELIEDAENTTFAGGIIGDNDYAACENCSNSGNISGNSSGGIIGGRNNGSSIFIQKCSNSGQISGISSAGGIVGYHTTFSQEAECPIIECQNTGDVSCRGTAVSTAGGIVGHNHFHCPIQKCFNTGQVSTNGAIESHAGGIAGETYYSSISYCYNKGAISAEGGSKAYGDADISSGGISADVENGNIFSCYNTGNISSEGSQYPPCYAGGIAGTAKEINNCYSTGAVYAKSNGGNVLSGGIGRAIIKNSYNTGKVEALNTGNTKGCLASGIGGRKSIYACLALNKDMTNMAIISTGGDAPQSYRIGSITEGENNYASSLIKIKAGEEDITSRAVGKWSNGDHGENWNATMEHPIDLWDTDIWDVSNTEILPKLKYEDGTLMPGQPSLLKSDFQTETPSEPEQPASPSDITLKSLSYKFGENGEVTPVPNFSSDVFNYEIGYDASLEHSGIKLYPSAVATNEKAKVGFENTELPGNAVVYVTSEDGKASSMYSIYALRKEDVGKKFYIKLYLHNLTAKINNTIYHNNDIYRGDHNDDVIVELIPDEGYKVPKTFYLHSGPVKVLDYPVESGGKIILPMTIHYEISASAQKDTGEDETSFVIDKLKYRFVDDKTVAVIGPDTEDNATWTVTNCTIPATVTYNGKTYSVTVIDEDAFFECSKLEKVILSEGLKSIRRVAFKHCYALTSITIPASVDSIGQYAFDMDEKLTQIELKEGLKVVEEGAFDGCSFKTLTIPASVKSFSTNQDIYELEQIIVKEGNTAYASEDGILYNKVKTDLLICPYMYPKKVCNIPKGVIRIIDNAFESCEMIEELILPEGLEIIEYGAFEYCDALKIIRLPSTIKKLEDSLFGTAYDEKDKCNVTEIHCAHKSPASIEIENGALGTIDKNNCILYVPKGCKTLYQQANVWKDFKNIIEEGEISATTFTIGLLNYTVIANNEVEVSGVTDKTQEGYDIKPTVEYQGKTYTVTAVGDKAFYECTKLVRFQPERVKMAIKTIGNEAFMGCSKLTNLLLNTGLEQIGESAFCECSSLQNLEIPASVTQIGDWAFNDCAKLANISVNSANKYFSSSNGVLFNKDKTTLLVYPNMQGNTNYIVPKSVTKIEAYAFDNCTNLPAIVLPENLKEIGGAAFYGCSKLTSIVLPTNLSHIGGEAFGECKGIKTFTIPASVTSLGEYIFTKCENTLQEIHCKRLTPPDICKECGYGIFANFGTPVTACKLYVPKGSKTAYAKALGWKDFKYILEERENPPLIPDKIDDEIILNNDSTYTDGEGNTGHFNGMIGDGKEETTINRLTIKGSATSTTTTVVINKVTVGDGSTTTETTTSVTQNTNVVIELIGDNSLGKLVNDGIAKLISKVEAALTNTVVINNGTFVDETGLLTRVEGAAELDITVPSDQEVRPGENVTLTASTKVSVTYAVTFIWEQLQPDGTWKAVGSPNVYTPARSGLRSTATVTDRLTIQAKDAGKYRCVIRNKVGNVSSTLTTPPATVTAKSTVDIVAPKSYRKVTPYGNQLHFEISTPTEVKIINLNGAIIRSVSLPAGDTYIDGLDKGVYILLFEDGVTQKVRI